MYSHNLRHLPWPKHIIQSPGNGDQDNHPRHHTAKNQEQPLPVAQATDDNISLGQADTFPQVLDEVLWRGNRPQGPGQMRFQGFYIFGGKFFLSVAHTSSLTQQGIVPVQQYQGPD